MDLRLPGTLASVVLVVAMLSMGHAHAFSHAAAGVGDVRPQQGMSDGDGLEPVFLPLVFRNGFPPALGTPGPQFAPTPEPRATPEYSKCVAVEEARYDDASLRWLARYEYDAVGRLHRLYYDTDGDGWDRVETWKYSDDGRLASETLDSQVNGTVDRARSFVYDARGWRLRALYDGWGLDGADGVPDRITEWTYDEYGDSVKIVWRDGLDGTPESIVIRRFSPPGRLVQVLVDDDADGVFDHVYEQEWSDDFRHMKVTYDRHRDGVVDSVEEYTWDAAGRILEHVIRYGPEDGDGGVMRTVYQYNSFGRPASVNYYRDGHWHDSQEYTYGEHRRLESVRYTSASYAPYTQRYQYEGCLQAAASLRMEWWVDGQHIDDYSRSPAEAERAESLEDVRVGRLLPRPTR